MKPYAAPPLRRLCRSRGGREIPSAADFKNTTWRDWIEWRFEKMGDFISDCRTAVRKGNSGFVLFNEFWDGSDWYTTEAGCPSVRTRAFHDCIAHEWNVREPPKKYKAFDWKCDLATYRAYRGFDGEHPSWIRSYSQSIERSRTLASTQLRELFQNDVWSRASIAQLVTLPGREWLAVDLYYEDSRIVARVTNYKGIKAPSQKPVPDKGVTLDIRIPDGFSPGSASIVELLGAERSQVFSQPSAGIVRFKLNVANHVAIELREVARRGTRLSR